MSPKGRKREVQSGADFLFHSSSRAVAMSPCLIWSRKLFLTTSGMEVTRVSSAAGGGRSATSAWAAACRACWASVSACWIMTVASSRVRMPFSTRRAMRLTVTLVEGVAAGAGSGGRSLARGSARGADAPARGASGAGVTGVVSVATSSAWSRLEAPRRAAMANVRLGDMERKSNAGLARGDAEDDGDGHVGGWGLRQLEAGEDLVFDGLVDGGI